MRPLALFERVLGPIAVAAVAALTLATVPLPSFTTQSVSLTLRTRSRLQQVQLAHEVDSDWNCFVLHFAGEPVEMLVANDEATDPDRAIEIRQLAKAIYPEAVRDAGGAIGQHYDSGVLVAVELRVFDDNPMPVPAPSHAMDVIGILEDDQGAPLAEVYLFDALQWTLRRQVIENTMGVTLGDQDIWLGPTLLAADSGDHAAKLSGQENTVFGDMRSAGAVKVTGSSQTVPDSIIHGTGFTQSGTGHFLPAVELDASPVDLPGLPRSANEYRDLALAAGTYFVGDVTVVPDGSGGMKVATQVVSGVLYATGDLYVEGDGMNAAATFVSEEGISFSGDQNTLTASVDGALAIAIGGAVVLDRMDNNIVLDGRQNDLTGSMWAPGGQVEFFTTDNELTGTVVAQKIRLAGSENVLNDGTRQ